MHLSILTYSIFVGGPIISLLIYLSIKEYNELQQPML
jgi:hypothetical protein